MLWDKMSLINKKLKKTKFHPGTLFPTNLREGDLIFENGKSFAVVGVLRPGEDKINFFRDQNYNKSVEKLFSTIKESKNEYIVFLIDYTCNLFYRRYHPFLPINVNCYKDKNGLYNRKKGLDIWLLKFSVDYVSMRKVISNPRIYHDFISTIDDKGIREEVEAVSSLMSLQYS